MIVEKIYKIGNFNINLLRLKSSFQDKIIHFKVPLFQTLLISSLQILLKNVKKAHGYNRSTGCRYNTFSNVFSIIKTSNCRVKLRPKCLSHPDHKTSPNSNKTYNSNETNN